MAIEVAKVILKHVQDASGLEASVMLLGAVGLARAAFVRRRRRR